MASLARVPHSFFFHKGVTPRGRMRALVSGGECKIMSRWRQIMSRWHWSSFHTHSLQAHLHSACLRAAARESATQTRVESASVASQASPSTPEPGSGTGSARGHPADSARSLDTLAHAAHRSGQTAAARKEAKCKWAWRERVRKEGQCRRDIICLQRDIILHSPSDTRALILPRGVTPLWKKKNVAPLQDLP